MANIICGVIQKNKKFYFSFDTESKILTIQPTKMQINQSLILEHDFEDYPYLKNPINICGETNEHRYIEFMNVKFSSIGRGCFQAWVPAYIIGLTNGLYPIAKPNNIKEIVFQGECIDRLLTAKKNVSNDWDEKNNKLQINVEYGKDKIKEFNFNKNTYSFVPSWKMPSTAKDVINVLIVNTYLKISSKNKLRVEKIIELYKNVERFFSFSCNRQHVEFEKILLRETIPVDYFGNIKETTIEFELFVSSDSVQRDIPVIGRTLTILDEFTMIPNIMKSLEENKFILLSFPNSALDASIVDNDKYINIASSFEAEFDKLYPKYKTLKNKDFKLAKENILAYLNKEMENKQFSRKTRGYFKDFYDYIELNEGRLEEKLCYVYEKYESIIIDDINYYKNKFSLNNISKNELAKAFSIKRNLLSHGAKLEKFNKLEIVAYSLLRKINYAMILERSGFNKDSIKRIVEQIM